MAISLSDKEMSALAGLPHLLVCLYVMAIRPRMDFKTAMVGIRPRISLQALAEWLYVEPERGRTTSGSPHRSTIRRSLDQLTKAGLIEPRNKEKELVFFLPMAKAGFHVQKKPDANPTHNPDTANTLPALAVKRKPDTPKTAIPDTHQISDKELKPPPPTSPGGGVVVDLIFSGIVIPSDQRAIIDIFTSKGIPPVHWQTILDEYYGQHLIRPISNPIAYLRKLANKMCQGEFVAERAGQVADLRDRHKANDERQKKQVLQERGGRGSPTDAEIESLPPRLRGSLSRVLSNGSPIKPT